MDERVRRAIAITGVAFLAYGVGYLHGHLETVKALGTVASNEALFYLAARDVSKKMFDD